jgi:hypothetical protein
MPAPAAGPSVHLLSLFVFAVVVDDIVDVRKGWKTDTFNKIERTVSKKQGRSPGRKPAVDEARCFSIVHGRNKQSLDLVAPTAELADVWVRGLQHLVTVLHGLQQEERFERYCVLSGVGRSQTEGKACMKYNEEVHDLYRSPNAVSMMRF